jgi:hypothetical protein
MRTVKSVRISASLIKDYVSCPKKAFYRLYEPESGIYDSGFRIGMVVHELIEKYWKSSSDMASHMKEIMDKHGIRYNSNAATAVGKNIKAFSVFREYLDDGDIIEQSFYYPMDDVTIVGKMDRITKDGIIFDWKTGKNPPESLYRDPQFILYYLSYKKLYGKVPKAVYYASLANKQLYMFKPDEFVIRDFEQNLLPDIIKQIKERHFPAYGLYGYKVCNKCPFVDACFVEVGIDE